MMIGNPIAAIVCAAYQQRSVLTRKTHLGDGKGRAETYQLDEGEQRDPTLADGVKRVSR